MATKAILLAVVFAFSQIGIAAPKANTSKTSTPAKDAAKVQAVEKKSEPEAGGDGPVVSGKCEFTVSIGGTAQKETIIIGVFGGPSDTPKTAKNFMDICAGDKAKGQNGKMLTYTNSIFHRIIPQFMLQGGDITKGNGTGGESIYGEKFADENFKYKHVAPGFLSMANAGPNTNGSQFFITTVATPWLDGRHVVFGRVIRGLNVVMDIEKMGSESGTPKSEVKIVKAAVIK